MRALLCAAASSVAAAVAEGKGGDDPWSEREREERAAYDLMDAKLHGWRDGHFGEVQEPTCGLPHPASPAKCRNNHPIQPASKPPPSFPPAQWPVDGW